MGEQVGTRLFWICKWGRRRRWIFLGEFVHPGEERQAVEKGNGDEKESDADDMVRQ